ncbi:hypothetical protein JG688_00000660 [Phytophthora aleatoria]|uniref:Phosphatidylinositol-3,5-bisphosphate 3-phosphatase n=1 Tax=Phytophthora aleatoria TaxID=2496075 RepID=A0A8J5J7M1_9STRA|nr:hypothetical protein JG688_00000660 [Phytophthora aleatoria]
MLSSAKSMDDEAVRLAVLRDPKRMAALLVRAFSSSILDESVNGAARRRSTQTQEEEDEEVEETQEEFQELERRGSAGTAAEAPPLRVVIRPVAEDDEDDAGELDEEEDDDEEKPLDEEELEAAATALQTATRIVEELRLKMLLKAGQQMERQRQDNDEPPISSIAEANPSSTEGPGAPVPRARVRSNSACSGCGKSFNPFHRSKNCSACGFAFCPKCSSKNFVLPTCFGYRDESVRTCDLCAKWFQKAMDRYFDAMELAKDLEHDSSIHRGSMGEITIEEKPRSLSSFNNSTPVDVPPDQNGWNLLVDEREFKRQIGGDPAVSPFLKFYKNDRGNICKSYPSKLLLPASMNSATLAKVADFRAKNRLPVITYFHRRNRCVLTRSSQPLLGNLLSGTSNVSDQLLLGVYRRLPDIIKNQSQSSQSSRPLYIFDARKPKASTGNRLMGKGGVETPQDYPGAVIHHLNIANMYRMQSSFMGLMKLFLPGGVEDTDRTWLSSVESTRWLDHVRLVLDGALKIARVLELEGASALVHCSDGWDRTAQLCALAQLIIDPYYRTIRGFATLVEKDWLAFGHKYAERCGSDRNRDPQRNKSSPIMFQFIDAVWQMQRQYPRSFEFNERFLLHLANSLTSGLYGTFMYDSRLQRDVNEVKYITVSVWTPVLMKPELYSNSNYEMHDGPIWPWVSCKMMRLWENYFFQWHPKYYKCQWACSLIYHGPSSSRGGTSSGDKDRENVQQQTPHRDAAHVKDPPALDLLATPITSSIAEEDGAHDVPIISLSSEDEDSSTRVRTASGTYTQKASKRSIFGLTRGSRQRSQSEENGSQEVC